MALTFVCGIISWCLLVCFMDGNFNPQWPLIPHHREKGNGIQTKHLADRSTERRNTSRLQNSTGSHSHDGDVTSMTIMIMRSKLGQYSEVYKHHKINNDWKRTVNVSLERLSTMDNEPIWLSGARVGLSTHEWWLINGQSPQARRQITSMEFNLYLM